MEANVISLYQAMLEFISLMKRGVVPKIRKAGDGDGEDVNGGDGGDGGDGGGGGGRRKMRKENERLRKERNRLNAELERAIKRQRQNDREERKKTEKPAGYTGEWCDTCADKGRRPDACKHRKQECAFENDACFR